MEIIVDLNFLNIQLYQEIGQRGVAQRFFWAELIQLFNIRFFAIRVKTKTLNLHPLCFPEVNKGQRKYKQEKITK